VGYGPFSLWVIHKEGLCPSSGDIHRLMMVMIVKTYGAATWTLTARLVHKFKVA
jgi:hypothetical protein